MASTALDADKPSALATQRQREARDTSTSGPQRESGAEGHAALSSDLHSVLGNQIMQASVLDEGSAYGSLIESAMTLGAAGVGVADSAAGLMTNSRMQAVMRAHISRHAAEPAASAEATQRRLGVAVSRGGQPLPPEVLAKMQAAFDGADFSGVRVHTDGAAAAAAAGVNAYAFAVGEDLYFAHGQFRPHSVEGQHLIAHELTHVVQHQEGRLPSAGSEQVGGVSVSSSSDAHEREAESVAADVVSALSRGEHADSSAQAAPTGDGGDVAAEAGLSVDRSARGGVDRQAPVREPLSSGQPLPSRLQQALRSQLGPAADQVRVHTDPEAARFATSLNAHAVTIGTNIYFGRGEFQPGSTKGDQLIGHEVHHAVVGGGGAGVSQPGDAHERAADAFGDTFAQARSIQDVLSPLATEASEPAVIDHVEQRLAPASDAPIMTPAGGGGIHRQVGVNLAMLSIEELKAIEGNALLSKKEREDAKKELDRRLEKDGNQTYTDHEKGASYERDDGSWNQTSETNTFPGASEDTDTDTGSGVSDDEFFKDLPPVVAQEFKDRRQGYRSNEDGSHSFPYTDADGTVQWKTYAPGEDGKLLTYSQAHKNFNQDVDDGNIDGEPLKAVKPVGGGEEEQKPTASEEEEAAKKKINVETNVTLVEGKFLEESVTSGAVLEGDGYKVLTADAKVDGGYTVGPNGGNVKVEASAAAKLVEIDKTWSWESDKVTFLGEEFSGTVFIFVKGMVGVEAKASIEANAKLMESKKATDPDMLLQGTDVRTNTGAKDSEATDRGPGASVGASGEVFAGARVQLGAGGAFNWFQKDEKDYASEIKSSASVLGSAISVANPGLGWLLRQAGGDEAVAGLMGDLLDWSAGQVKLLGAQAAIEGSAGIGAQIDAAVGFSGGKFTFRWKAGVTFGFGAGVSVDISIDMIEGIKFAIIGLGKAGELVSKLTTLVSDWVKANIDDMIDSVGDLWDSFFDWLSADDKIREAVANRGHEATPANIRGQWIETLSGGWCGDEDEDAIVSILRFSKKNGDLDAVLSAGMSRDDILGELGGDQWYSAKRILGGS